MQIDEGQHGSPSAWWPVGLASVALGVALVLWLAVALGCVFLITPEMDEASVLNGLWSLGKADIPHQSTPAALTNGGPFALANLALEATFGSVVWVHRLFSMACLLATMGLVARQAGGPRRSAMAGLLAVSPMVGLPGTAEVGTAVLGTSTAVLLLVLGCLAWSRSAAPGPGRAVACGLLFGLAATSRFDLVLFAPAFLIASSVRLDAHSRPRLGPSRAAVAATAIGLGVFVTQYFAYNQFLKHTMDSPTGTSGFYLDYPDLLNKWVVASSFVPLSLLALVTVAGCRMMSDPGGPGDGTRGRLSAILLALAWTLWLGWLFRAPYPHLRYLWPSLACFAILGGLGLAALREHSNRAGRPGLTLTCQVVALGLVLGGVGNSARSVVMGDGDTIAWEWMRGTGLDYFRRFQALASHRAAIAYLKDEIPPDAEVYVYPGSSSAFRYEAHRPIIQIDEVERPAPGPDRPRRRAYFVLTPTIGPIFGLDPGDYQWFEAHARLAAQFGRYSFYELPDGLPEDAPLSFHNFGSLRGPYLKHPQSRPWFGRNEWTMGRDRESR